MPELPEVQTTVDGLNKTVKGKKILDVWTSYNSSFHAGKDNIKNPAYFKKFKKEIIGATIKKSVRVGKNVLIELSPSTGSGRAKTVLIHMKMTGHLMYGKYKFQNHEWVSSDKNSPLSDPFNRFIRLIFILSGGKQLAFSDMRKFAKVTLIDTGEYSEDKELAHLGIDALKINFKQFKNLIDKETKPIKQTLMDQEIISGVGNIYADECLWLAGIDPRSKPTKIPEENLKKLFVGMRTVLKKGIDFGGDSMSDYRNIYGERGKFQNKHNAYRKTGEKCNKRGCSGTIKRIVIGARSGHFCPVHQKLF
ncbi:MAG: bifunctional DNA-formamidopyrimidine glycosylase/DNA-(apurinic or apyrimidinic site) lyase [Minisyncoccia bacterium]